MQPLAKKAMDAWKREEVKFYPAKWENTYTRWLTSIRDWCISRQLWWGHRIPVWYCRDCEHMMVEKKDPAVCSACGSENIVQDKDVLDTWFSSWLWPFSTLGWPDKSDDLHQFYPTTALVTAYDIIFFWVARMIMAGLEFTGQVPFRDIYIHGLIRDIEGRKMSKSLGNGLDPLDVVGEYGADALKFTLAFLAAQGQDIRLGMESFQFGSKFANKIWNAVRYLLMNLEGRRMLSSNEIELEAVDIWIYHRLNQAAMAVKEALGRYRFDDAARAVYEYFWSDFCDWYIEGSKLSLYSDDPARQDRAITLLMEVLEESLRLLHPFVSFVTEHLYQKLPNSKGNCITAPYPEYTAEREAPEVEKMFSLLQELIVGIRTLRSEFTIPPNRKIPCVVYVEENARTEGFFKSHTDLISLLIQGSDVRVVRKKPDSSGTIPVAGSGFEGYVYIKDIVDVPREVGRLEKERQKLSAQVEKSEKKLSNSGFLKNAPPQVVEKERRILWEGEERIKKVDSYIRELTE